MFYSEQEIIVNLTCEHCNERLDEPKVFGRGPRFPVGRGLWPSRPVHHCRKFEDSSSSDHRQRWRRRKSGFEVTNTGNDFGISSSEIRAHGLIFVQTVTKCGGIEVTIGT